MDDSPAEPQAIFGRAELDLTVVVPYFNPGKGFQTNLSSVLEVLDALEISYEVIAVSDGSTDDSPNVVAEFGNRVRHVTFEENQGKGQALRIGFVLGRGKYLGFIDADGDIAPATLKAFWERARDGRPDIVYGSKRHKESRVSYPPIRRLYSWGYHRLVRLLFRLKVRDTQVGCKLIRRDVLAASLPRMLEKRFAFDLELFVVARHVGFRTFQESPLVLNRGFTTTVSTRTVFRMILDTSAIWYRLMLRRYYDKPHRMVLPDGGYKILNVDD